METIGQLHNPGEIAPDTHWIGGLRAGLDAVEKRKIMDLSGIESYPFA
jgi:hypothetical protein